VAEVVGEGLVGAGEEVRAGAEIVDGGCVALGVGEAGGALEGGGVEVVEVGAEGDGGGVLGYEEAVGFDGAEDGGPGDGDGGAGGGGLGLG